MWKYPDLGLNTPKQEIFSDIVSLIGLMSIPCRLCLWICQVHARRPVTIAPRRVVKDVPRGPEHEVAEKSCQRLGGRPWGLG